jgi:hypothetical protein
MQSEYIANSGYHATNATVRKNEDQMVEATTIFTEANSRLARQLKDHYKEVKEVKALLKNERAGGRGQIAFTPSLNNYS